MARYLVISTVVVLAVATIVAGWMNRDLIRLKIAPVNTPVSPKPAPLQTVGSSTPPPLSGDAPWALSALPDCLIQTSETTGPSAYVLAHLPPGAQLVRPPAKLAYGDCTISIVGDEAYVVRGTDRYRIPPHVRFYRTAGWFAQLREYPNGNDLRIFQPAGH